MLRRIRYSILCFISAVISVHSVGAQQQNVVQNVQQSFNAMNDAVIHYRQVVLFPLTRQEQSFEGVVYMKKPGRYRIESDQQTVITDGTTIWSYNPFTEQVIIDTFREDEQALTPDRFLLTIPDDFYATVGDRETVDDRLLITLRLIPKHDHQFVRSIQLWVDETAWLVRKAEVVDVNDNRTTYIVDEMTINGGVDESLFVYKPGSDVEVIDLR
jgi:outer membrane lipoprotein carrier protein